MGAILQTGMIRIHDIDTPSERMQRSDVNDRFVIDLASLKPEGRA